MTNYMQSGRMYYLNDETATVVHEVLPPGNYVVQRNPSNMQIYLQAVEGFERPSKLYGDTLKNTDRILNTFMDRPNSTGVLLAGEKGSGKTLLAKNLVMTAAERFGVPTIIINAPWHGDEFNKFIQSISQPCVVVFDEFEKVYDRDDQEQMLTLLDGVFPSKKLFILTCNDRYRIDNHMRNRPGRIYYMIDFNGLAPEFIREYCEDNLNNKSYIDKILAISSVFEQFNFDMLKAIVEEMNRYNEPPTEAIKILNAKFEYAGHTRYDIETLKVDGDFITDPSRIGDRRLAINPLRDRVAFGIDYDDKEDEYKISVEYMPTDIKRIDPQEGVVIYAKDDNELVLRRIPEKNRYYEDLIF